MTRKITLSIILIILILGCYQLMFGKNETIRTKVANFGQLASSSKKLDTDVAELEKSCTTDYENKKEELEKAIKDYKKSKEEYDQVVPAMSAETTDAIINYEENNLKDIYDVDFLWTIVGNYATEEGVNLKFDIQKNTTSASSLSNTSTNYIVCDLKFIVTGKYINLTDFIYDLEDDDRLGFEINDFEMQKDGENLQITLTVKEVKVNASNLIESKSEANSEEKGEINTTQTIDSTMGNTTKENKNAVSNEISDTNTMQLNNVN